LVVWSITAGTISSSLWVSAFSWSFGTGSAAVGEETGDGDLEAVEGLPPRRGDGGGGAESSPVVLGAGGTTPSSLRLSVAALSGPFGDLEAVERLPPRRGDGDGEAAASPVVLRWDSGSTTASGDLSRPLLVLERSVCGGGVGVGASMASLEAEAGDVSAMLLERWIGGGGVVGAPACGEGIVSSRCRAARTRPPRLATREGRMSR
jgi:hypothetical protein